MQYLITLLITLSTLSTIHSFPTAKLSLANEVMIMNSPIKDYFELKLTNTTLIVYGDLFCVHFDAVDSQIIVHGTFDIGEYDSSIDLTRTKVWVRNDFSFGGPDPGLASMKRDYCPSESKWMDSQVTVQGDFIIAMNYWIVIYRDGGLPGDSDIDFYVGGRFIKTDHCHCGCNGGLFYVPVYNETMIENYYVYIGEYTAENLNKLTSTFSGYDTTTKSDEDYYVDDVALTVVNNCTETVENCNVLIYTANGDTILLISQEEHDFSLPAEPTDADWQSTESHTDATDISDTEFTESDTEFTDFNPETDSDSDFDPETLNTEYEVSTEITEEDIATEGSLPLFLLPIILLII